MEYTVRFQNTGTDTAFNIVIEDQLDADLDWTTFRPISSSHPFEVFLYEDGLLEFKFRNIALPDSFVNEVGSHGFVKYRILGKSGLAENTLIKNSAAIFFDFNPPILTNSTKNTLVSLIPTSIKPIEQKLRYTKVFPNPFLEYTTIAINHLENTEGYTIRLLDFSGRIIGIYPVNRNHQVQIKRESLASGIYFYLLSDETKSHIIEAGKLIAQ